MWLAGARINDIEAMLGGGSISWEMTKMRREGYDLPHHLERMRRLLDNWPAETP